MDQPTDVKRFRERMGRVAGAFPRLRRKVTPTFGRLAPPRWVDDPDFHLDFHLRRVAVPGDGSDRDLLDLAAELSSDPFDRTRPLWRFWMVEGLAEGRGAVIQQIHHTITDGEGGVRLSAMMLDLERDAAEPMMPIPEPDGGEDPVDLDRSMLDGLRDAVTHNARRQAGVVLRGAGSLVDTLSHPETLPGALRDGASMATSLARQALVADPARSPLWTERSLHRHLETLRVPLDDARRAAKALGGTVNDFFVAGAAAAAGDLHRRRGHPVDELRISMPVSTRQRGESGGNAFSPMRLLVPTGLMAPSERFGAIHEQLGATKGERAITAASNVAGLINLLPTSLLVRTGRQIVSTIDFAVSNVRGAPFDLYMAGAKILANYPVGPTAGTAFNLTLLSSGGMLDMGLNCDAAAVDDPEELKECLELAYEELLSA
jgi:WS/DGAT/MGAT family acyltransferase